MLRSRAAWVARVSAVLMGFSLILPAVQSAEAASTSTQTPASKKKTTTTGASQSKAKSTAKSTAKSKAKRVTPKRTSKRTVKRKVTTRRYSAARSRARRARLARAKAAKYARDLRELQTPKFRMDANGLQVPDVRAEAAIIYNPVTHEVLWEENMNSARSIASITKVMTAIVYLEHAPSLTDEITVQPVDVRAASTTYLRANERLTADTLLHLLLIGSDNAAARVLARNSAFGTQGFIDRMNQKAKELGLEATHYSDTSGLDPANVSSAYDMARLIAFAGNDERIASIMRMSARTVRTSRRTITVRNTNKLVGGDDLQVRGGKTGFIRQAGYCLATLLQMPQGDPVAVVVLGARSSAGRFMETKHLVNWLADRTKALLTAETPKATPEPQPE